MESYQKLAADYQSIRNTLGERNAEVESLSKRLNQEISRRTVSLREDLQHDFDIINLNGIVIGSNPILAHGKFQAIVRDKCSVEIVDYTGNRASVVFPIVEEGKVFQERSLSVPIDVKFASLGKNQNDDSRRLYDTCYYYFSVTDAN